MTVFVASARPSLVFATALLFSAFFLVGEGRAAASQSTRAATTASTSATLASGKKKVPASRGKSVAKPVPGHPVRVIASKKALSQPHTAPLRAAPRGKPAPSPRPEEEILDPQQAQVLKEENAAQREQLRARLESLRQEISAGEATKTEAADALASSEQAISDANRKLHDLAKEQGVAQTDLSSINQRRINAKDTIAAQQLGLSKMLHDQYLGGGEDPYKLLFSGDNPNRIARDFEYFGYVSRAQATMLAQLQQSVASLEDLSRQAAQRTTQLDAIGAEQSAEKAQLLDQQEAHRATLAAISQKLEAQRAEAGNLARDDERLGRVVDELSKLIERQAKERRERERLAQLAREQQAREKARALEEKRKAEADAASKAEASRAPELTPGEMPANPTVKTPAPLVQPAPPSPAANENPEDQKEIAFAEFDGHFARLKGSLKLPAKGDLLAHFGATRAGGGPAWKGLFIRSAQGAEVHAVAPGRVVFAEWLRGFGNLLIIDHGDQYLSIYGNNESLLKQPGDIVKAGDLVATTGNSGGNPETGLYFELRYQGKPFDPLTWVGAR